MTPAPFARAEIIAVGSEMLALGRVDTNSGVIAGRLATLGIDLVARSVVGDQSTHLEIALRTALQRADVVLITGGLGPTDDDLTRQATAQALGRGMTEDAGQVARMMDRFAKRGIPMPEINRRQAMVIDGAVRLDNLNGTAPGQWIDLGAQAVALLPGPPREMVPMLDALVTGPLGARSGRARTYRRGLCVAGRSESAVEATLLPLYERWRALAPPLDVTILAALGRIELHLFARSDDAERASVVLDAAIAEAAGVLGTAVYSTADETLEEVAGRLLRERGWRVAVAESCTGGLLGTRLTDVPGSSSWFEGGVIVYSNALKTSLAGVSPESMARHGAVSEPVALALAAGARRAGGTEVGLGITGVAGPDGGSEDKPVGTVYIAIDTPEGAGCRRARFVGDRGVVRQQSVSAALDMIRLALTGHDPAELPR